MRIDILTVVPELLASPLNESILKRAQEKGLVEIHIHNIRDYTEDKHRTTDDYPFGGEAGMVMKIEPIYRCIEALKAEREYDEVIYTSPDGIRYDQHEANRLSTLDNLIILCGHYKGIDYRIREHLVTREISIGDYVLTGGELAACIIADSVIRIIPGAIGDEASALTDCFQDNLLAPPVYTRPAEFNGWKVPDVLLSGNFARIDRWKEEQAWEQISCRLSASPRKRRRLWKEWWKQVAILILLLGSGLLYYSLQQLQESRETALSQIVPGSRKAVLRLSDGREVTLEKETTCVLTEEDGTRISVGGQEHIVYQAVSQEQEKLAYNTITVPRGGEYSLVLSDGTRVWLNAETELTYPTVFGKGERKLMLKGEACFEVVTDTARPFIVESFYNRVEVLGTRFNVSAYTGKSAVKTTLLRGKVKVSNLSLIHI